MRPGAMRIAGLCGFALAVGGVVAALTLLLIPLPPVTQAGSIVAWCGPGATSDSALQVRLDPGIVNTGSIPGQTQPPASDQLALLRLCAGAADTRITEAVIIALVALVLGIAISLIARRAQTAPAAGRARAWGPAGQV